MKNIFKSLMIVVLFVGLGASAFAQVSSTINSTATVQTSLTITTPTEGTDDLVFGTVAQGVNASIDASTGVTTNCGTTAHLGKFTVTAQPEATIWVSFAYTNLTGPGDELVFTPKVFRTAKTTDTYGTDEITPGGEEYTVNKATTGDGTENGVDHFFVGGTIVIKSDQTVGDYAGTITMTVAYN